jgi:riboflavin biosynthesis pyrimidine reductase
VDAYENGRFARRHHGTVNGRNQWITSPNSRRTTMPGARARGADNIGTVLEDNPRLDVRKWPRRASRTSWWYSRLQTRWMLIFS